MIGDDCKLVRCFAAIKHPAVLVEVTENATAAPGNNDWDYVLKWNAVVMFGNSSTEVMEGCREVREGAGCVHKRISAPKTTRVQRPLGICHATLA